MSDRTDLVERMARGIADCEGCGPIMCSPEACHCLTAARAALTALEEAGFAVVPVKPTEEMLKAGEYVEMPSHYGGWPIERPTAERCWAAMLSAATREPVKKAPGITHPQEPYKAE